MVESLESEFEAEAGFLHAAEGDAWIHGAVLVDPGRAGVSRIQLNVRDGKRLNTWRAYLKPRLGEKNLRILTSTHARRLLIDDKQVTGLEVDFRGRVGAVSADEVILTAGALASPELLLRSGIGPAEELREVEIGPVLDLPGVGKNLQDH